MEDNTKVFSSKITRVVNNHKSNLNDLLNIVPATPIQLNETKVNTCDYSPKTGKYYIPKKKSRLKVKTVRDIRNAFEKDIYSYLTTDLESQQNILFKKIRRGSSRDDNTKQLATKILRGETPISRSTWQMLINLNPEHQKYSRQFVLWNGKLIQVNGSYGGVKKIICNQDLASKPQCLHSQNHMKQCLKQHERNKKRRLLRNSLAVTFKPGPLCKKQFLDNSHQKYHVGKIELINLPKAALDVQPKYGTAFDSSIVHFLNSLREEDGTITSKWAELSVSVLGTVVKSKAVQLNRDNVTFDLAYKYNQNRFLMRRDIDHCCNTTGLIDTDILSTNTRTVDIEVQPYVQLEIEEMLNKILTAVEINLIQDKLFTEEQELKKNPREDLNFVNNDSVIKDKTKRKFGELDRLDVTVITLPETEEGNLTRICSKRHCTYGCICASLKGTYNLKQHCGRVECMFDCKCDFLKYKSYLPHIGRTDIFPGLLSIDNQINNNLAKEEQKFHQTVIVSGENRILLKGQKRNWKTPQKYADFYSNMSLKHENPKTQNLSIVALKLNCDNIEPWCMVHKLYKCFCKGKFTDTCASILQETGDKELLSKDIINDVECLENSKEMNDFSSIEECEQRERSVKKSKTSDNSNIKSNKVHTSRSMDKTTNTNKNTENLNYSDTEDEIQSTGFLGKDEDTILQESSVSAIINMNAEKGMLTRHAVRKLSMQKKSDKNHDNKCDSEDSDHLDFCDSKSMSSSRTSEYAGRKYSDDYYKNTNDKILKMEKNDKRIQERLTLLYNKCCEGDATIKPTKNAKDETKPTRNAKDETNPTRNTKDETTRLLQFRFDDNKKGADQMPMPKRRRLDSNTSLVTWLETHYKQFRHQKNTGLFKNSLEPPKHGKVVLHTWDFILNRYRERKNLFLVLRKPPFRIFMAVSTSNPFFENCIDINDIRFAELHKYPETVKNLLINATELKDNFCILRGLSFCWELIGSVSKIAEGKACAGQADTPGIYMDMDTLSVFNQNNSVITKSVTENTEQRDSSTLNEFNQGDSEDNDLLFENSEHSETLNVFDDDVEITDSLVENTELNNSAENNSLPENMIQKGIQSITEKELDDNAGCSDDAGSSKWFVLTVENDFSEIRFFKKGFFVKYGSIINAISVARLSGKTVRLSSKKCIEQPQAPQFGIYAIPNDSEYCVFVGPYEMEESLGIETIKTILDVTRFKRTRGFWITTSKVDNLKVIDNPLSFVPQTNSRINSALIPLETNYYLNDGISNDQQEKLDMQESVHINKTEESKDCSPSKNGQIKIVKPIKIRKTNGFYHLASDGILKKISLQYPQNATKNMPVLLKPCTNMEVNNAKSLLKPIPISNDLNINAIPGTSEEASSDASSSAASQIKITAVFTTQNDDHIAKRTSHDRGMFILKPEEINRKLVQNKLTEISLTSRNENNINDETKKTKISQSNLENVTSEEQQSVETEWSFSGDDVYVISDDENCENTDTTVNCNVWTDVWIECTNVPKIGWITGKRNLDNLLSFRIPGCEYSEFCPEEEAITNINLELRKRINAFNNANLQWTVHESIDQLQGQELDPEKLYPDYILTSEGLTHTSEMIKCNMDNLKTYSKKQLKGKGRGTRFPHEIGKVGDENDNQK